jgi:NhaP-type Na+/H+ or K+/H+ antiporter
MEATVPFRELKVLLVAFCSELVLSNAVVLFPLAGISIAQQETAKAKMPNAIAATTVSLVMRLITFG